MNDPKTKRALFAAFDALAAYENRFGSTRPPSHRPRTDVNLVGPMDEEMSALRLALAAVFGGNGRGNDAETVMTESR